MTTKFFKYAGCFDAHLVTITQKDFIEENFLRSKFHEEKGNIYLLSDFCSPDALKHAREIGIIRTPGKLSFN